MDEYGVKNDIEKDFDEAYSQAWSSFGSWQTEAQKDIRAYLGDIYTAKEKQMLRNRGSDILNIQLIRRLVKWVAGFQADHRKGIKYSPIEGSDDKTASEMTEIVSLVMQLSLGYETISKAFEHALKTGLSLVNTFNDAQGTTRLDNLFYNQFILDPNFTRLDLHNCRYGIIRKFISKDQAKILLPDSLHSRIATIDDEHPATDEKFTNYTSPIVAHGRKMLAYDEFQERTTKEEIVLINRSTGYETVWEGTKKQLREQGPYLMQLAGIPAEAMISITRQKETIKVSSFLNGEHFDTQTDPFGLDDFSFTPIWCYYDPESDNFSLKLQGFVRGLREIQRAESKRIVAMTAWYENSIAQGVDFEEGAFTDPADAFATGGKPRQVAEGMIEKVRDRVTPPLPSGNIELHQILEDSMAKTIGLTPEMLGNLPSGNADQISGLVTQLRIGAGMTGQRGLFDDLSTSQNIIGDKVKKLIQSYPIEKIARMLGKPPTQAFKAKVFGKYDAVTSEAALTDTQKNTKYQELLAMKKLGAEIGDPAPITWGDLIEEAPIELNIEMMEKMAEREKQANQQKQASQKQQEQIQNITIDLLTSQAEQARAKASESPATIAEKLTKAAKNMTAAELDEAKSAGAEVDIGNSTLNAAIEVSKLGLEREKLRQPQSSGTK